MKQQIDLIHSIKRLELGSAFHRDYLLSVLYYRDLDIVIQAAKKTKDLQIKYDGRLRELRQCEEDRNQAWDKIEKGQ